MHASVLWFILLIFLSLYLCVIASSQKICNHVLVYLLLSHCHREDKHPAAISSSTVGQKGGTKVPSLNSLVWNLRNALWLMAFISCFIRMQLKSESRIRQRARTRRLHGKLPERMVGNPLRIHKRWSTTSRDWKTCTKKCRIHFP